MALLDLPAELLLIILNLVRRSEAAKFGLKLTINKVVKLSDLNHLSQASKSLHDLVVPLLYRSVILYPKEKGKTPYDVDPKPLLLTTKKWGNGKNFLQHVRELRIGSETLGRDRYTCFYRDDDSKPESESRRHQQLMKILSEIDDNQLEKFREVKRLSRCHIITA